MDTSGKDGIILWSLLAIYKFSFEKKKNPKFDEPQKPESRCNVNSWESSCLSGRVSVPLQSEHKLFHPKQLDSNYCSYLAPTMERDGSRLRLCFSFNGLAGCVQGPGDNLFLAVQGGESG